MTDEQILRQFTREMMGSSVAHMNDEQLDAWMEPWRKLADEIDPPSANPEYPAWFVKRRNEVRQQLLTVLNERWLCLAREHFGRQLIVR